MHCHNNGRVALHARRLKLIVRHYCCQGRGAVNIDEVTLFRTALVQSSGRKEGQLQRESVTRINYNSLLF